MSASYIDPSREVFGQFKDLPRDQTVYELAGEDRNCECGTEMREMGEVKSETLKVIPAQLRVEEHIRKN